MIKPLRTAKRTPRRQPRASPRCCQVDRPGQPRVGEIGVGGLIETSEVPGDLEQPGLDPSDGRSSGRVRRRLGWHTAPPTVLASWRLGPAELHPVEEQLMMVSRRPACSTVTAPRGSPRRAWTRGGLLPAQSAIAVLDREHPTHPGHAASPG